MGASGGPQWTNSISVLSGFRFSPFYPHPDPNSLQAPDSSEWGCGVRCHLLTDDTEPQTGEWADPHGTPLMSGIPKPPLFPTATDGAHMLEEEWNLCKNVKRDQCCLSPLPESHLNRVQDTSCSLNKVYCSLWFYFRCCVGF